MTKRSDFFTITLTLMFLFLISTSVIAARKGYFLDRLDGKWNGRGMIIHKPGVKKEAIRCRLRNERKNDKLTLRGNCSFGVTLIPMTGWIQRSGHNSYEASIFKSSFFSDMNNFSGKLEKNRLKLGFMGKSKRNNEIVKAHIVIHSENRDRFNIMISKLDAKTGNIFEMGTIRFSRK